VGERSDEIRTHIDKERERLGESLRELETKVKSTTDWRAYYYKSPGKILAAAFAGGLLISMLVGGSGDNAPLSDSDRDTRYS
jgi:hypothetical protein